jgi:hypothetical protein
MDFRPLVLILSAIVAAPSCRRDSPAPSQQVAPVLPANTPAPPSRAPARPLVPPGRGARVLVDVSEGLRGFTARRLATLSKLHQNVIEHALTDAQSINPSLQVYAPFQRCKLDTAIRCDAAPVPPIELGRSQTYSGRDAALHLALRMPPVAPRPDLQEPDPLDPYAVTVIVTDGFQSASGGAPTGASPTVACAGGPDSACIGELLAQRVRSGYGVWLVRLHLAFDGRYFAETELDEPAWNRVLQHVELLNRDPAWNGLRFRARHARFSTPEGAFDWEGARPLLVWILSRETAIGRSLVAAMRQRLAVERITVRDNLDLDVATAELAPFDGISALLDPASIRRVRGGGAADVVIVDAAERSSSGVAARVRCPMEGVAQVSVAGAIALRGVAPPPFVRLNVAWRSPVIEAGISPLTSAIPAQVGPFAATLDVNCRHLRQGTSSHGYEVYARWSLDDAMLRRQWFVTESGTTSYESPDRVYDLERTVVPPLRVATGRAGVMDSLALTLVRR